FIIIQISSIVHLNLHRYASENDGTAVHHFSSRPQIYKKTYSTTNRIRMVDYQYNVQDEAKGERYVI
ncbi:MAG: hypothetical protein WCE33_08970, partial [Nitrososphaeraceae archaeon]